MAAPQKQVNKIELCVKTASAPPAKHTFNTNEKVKDIVTWGVHNFGLPPRPQRDYKAFLELPSGSLRELNLELPIDEQGITAGACIIISTPQNIDGC